MMTSVLATLAAAAVAGAIGQANAEEPPALRALERAGLASQVDWSSRLLRSSFVPAVALGARVEHVAEPAISATALEVYARLVWPLESRALDRDAALLGEPARAERRRAALTAEVDARQRRVDELQAQTGARVPAAAAVETEIDLEEAEAELQALAGPPDGER
jgi:hypothetical protein